MRQYLENRIKELKEADLRACEKRWDMSKPQFERAIWREQSNEITARRHELEAVLNFLNSENTEGVSDASTESGVLHGVGESHASGQTDNDSLASDELPLEKITDYGNSIITLKCPDYPQCDCKDNCSRFNAENASFSND